MLSVILCDDSEVLRAKYRAILEEAAARHAVRIQIQEYTSAEALLFHLSESPGSVDILFLDVEMVQMNGIDAARALRRRNCSAQIIFLTSYPGYVFDSFDVRPLQYLLKHKTSPEQLEKVFLEAVQAAEADSHASFLVKNRDSLVRVPLRDILYLESLRNRIIVHCGNREYSYIGSLEAAGEKLAGYRFLRISRCYLINPQKFSQLMDTSLLLTDGTTLQISRRYKKSVKEFLRSYYEQLPVSSAQG